MTMLTSTNDAQQLECTSDELPENHCQWFSTISREIDREIPTHRIDEAAVFSFVPHSFNLEGSGGCSPKTCWDPDHGQQESNPLPMLEENDTSMTDMIQETLNRSRYPLKSVRCRCNGRTLALTGVVTRYYHLQMAIQAVKEVASGRRIDVQIKVL